MAEGGAGAREDEDAVMMTLDDDANDDANASIAAPGDDASPARSSSDRGSPADPISRVKRAAATHHHRSHSDGETPPEASSRPQGVGAGRGRGVVQRLTSVARNLPAVGHLFVPADGAATTGDESPTSSPTAAAAAAASANRFPDGVFNMRLSHSKTKKDTEWSFIKRVSSVSSLLSDTLERQLGRFGPAGVSEENRRRRRRESNP